MNYAIRPRKRLNQVISSWTTFAFVLFFFYIIGDLLADWWHNAWWVWMILGFSLIGAISTTFRYFASGPERQSEFTQESEQSAIIEPQSEEISTNVKFCKNCGAAIESPSQFCASCGEEL